MKNIKTRFENLQNKENEIINIIKKHDSSLSPSSKTILQNISQIIIKAKHQKDELEIYKDELAAYEAKLRIRYLYTASTNELKKQEILLRRDWRRPRAKRKIDLAKIDPKNCSIIDYKYDTIVEIPKGKKFRSIVTPHERWSFQVDIKNNKIYIKDREKFWEISHYLVIETD